MRRWGWVVAALVLAAACSGDGGDDGDAASTVRCELPPADAAAPEPAPAPPAPATKAPGRLTVGFYLGDTMLAFGQGGVSMGFEVEMMQEVARGLGLEFALEGNNDAVDLVPQAEAGAYDVAVSALTADPAHAATLDYTRPYLSGRLALTVREEDAEGRSIDALPEGAVIGVKRGTAAQTYVLDRCGGVAVRPFEQTRDALGALVDGRVDAVVHEFPPIRFVYQPEWFELVRMVEVFRSGERFVAAVPKGHPDMLAAVDAQLAGLDADGTLRALEQEWVLDQVPEGARVR